MRLTHREIQHYLLHQWNASIGLGSIAAIIRRVSDALAIPTQQAWNALIAADVRYVDEAVLRECNKRSWLWAAVCSHATAFRVAPTRGSIALEECFGDALQRGIFVSDRCRSYRVIDIDRRAICHAHLKRDFVKMNESGPPLGKEIGSAALVVHRADASS